MSESLIQERCKYIHQKMNHININQLQKDKLCINQYIDHTLLSSDATPQQIDNLCTEAVANKFASVCVNGCHAEQCVKKLVNTNVKVCCVIGFPLGAMTTKSKVFETKELIEMGVEEIDMVINQGWMKSGLYQQVYEEISQIAIQCHKKYRVLKVIIEATCLESDSLIIDACLLCQAAGADFVKTSTGMHKNGGANVEHVKLMREVVGESCGVKAAGGVRTLQDAHQMIEAGATRLGTSGGVQIIQNQQNTQSY